MVAPLVGIAIGAAARAVAKKAAGKAVKKAVTKKAAKAAKGLKKSDDKLMTEVIQSRSVRPVKSDARNADVYNKGSLMRTTDAATGAAAKKGAARLGVTGKKGVQPPVKISSAATKAAKTKAAAKVESKAIKAANKKLPKKNY
jgi:hypothetical protein